jgi:hypothetical protein
MSTYKGKNYFIAFFIAATIIVIIESFKSKDEKPPVVSKKGRNIIIGDSHGVGISFITKNAKAENGLAKSGWTLTNVMNALKNKSIDNTVSRVFISIGTNGQFSTKDDVNGFVSMIKTKFPQATIYIYGGSYGWSGSLSKSALETRFNNYYKRFKDLGIYVMKSKLGYFNTDAGAHSIKSNQAKDIAQEIDQLSK